MTASSTPATDLTVEVSVIIPYSFRISGAIQEQVTIAGGSTTAVLTVPTAADNLDEIHGNIIVNIDAEMPAVNYTKGSPGSASVVVQDDDVPTAPEQPRANGHLENGNVTLRWDAVDGAPGYNVRYWEMGCASISGRCTPLGPQRTVTGIPTTGTTTIEAKLAGLTDQRLYRVEVQAVIVQASACRGPPWSMPRAPIPCCRKAA